MAVIYLKHELHGTKVAVAEEEAAADEKNGWARYEAGVLLTPQVASVELPEPAEAPRQRRRRSA